MKQVIQIEKRIKGKMSAIKRGEVTPKDSGIAILLNALKDLDEVSYETHLTEYKGILAEIKK